MIVLHMHLSELVFLCCQEIHTTFFMSTWWENCKNMQKNWNSMMSTYPAHPTGNFCHVLVCPQKAIVRMKFLAYFWNLLTLLVSRSEYQRDKPFLLTMVSYLKKYILKLKYKRKKIPSALSDLPANWPGLTSLFGWIGLAS